MLEIQTFPAAILIRVFLDYDFGWSNIPEQTVLAAASGHEKRVLLDLNACNQIDTHGMLSLSRLHEALGARLNIVLSDRARMAAIVRASGMLSELPMLDELPSDLQYDIHAPALEVRSAR